MPRSRPPPSNTQAKNHKEGKPPMSVKKNYTHTIVHGFNIIEGEAVPQSITVDGCFHDKRKLQSRVAKEFPNFAVDTFTAVKQTYNMTDADFKASAEIIDTVEL